MGYPTRRKVLVLFAALVMMSLVAARASAANLNATPSLALSGSWDSNIFNTELNEESDYVFRAAPRLSLALEGPTTKGELIGGIEGEKYADHDELDDETATKSVELRLTRRGPRLTITPSARFVETNDTTRRDVLALTADPISAAGVLPVETVITERVRMREFSGALRIAYVLSPTLALDLGGGAQKREFAENVSGFEDSESVTGYASLLHSFTPRTRAGVFFETSYNSFDEAPNSRSYTAGLRGSYRASEFTTIDASAGATLLREDVPGVDETDDEWFPTGSISVAYAKEDFRATLLGSYAVAGGGSFGETTERTTVSLALSDRFAPQWSWNLGGSFQRNRSTDDQVASPEEIDTASAGAGIRYQAATWASIGLSGNMYRQRSDTTAGRDLDRETALLDVTVGNTFRLF